MARRLICGAAGALLGVLLGGCSGATPPVLPSLPEIAEALSLQEDQVVGSPTEVYARVARGAMACWFGTAGPLKANYVYHAEAEPASKGGKSEIVIHERDRNSENPRGLRAFRVAIAPKDASAAVDIEILKLPDPLAKSMQQDVRRWAAGAIGCGEGERQWSPKEPDAHDDPDTWRPRAVKGRAT